MKELLINQDAMISVKEATSYLKEYGIVKRESQTRDFIRLRRLKAIWNGSPNDYRAGMSISTKELERFLKESVSDFEKLVKIKKTGNAPELLTTSEAFHYLKDKGMLTNVSQATFRKLANEGRIPSLSIVGTNKFLKEELEEYAKKTIQNKDEPGHVYLMRDRDSGLCKIGKTKKAVYFRLKAIESTERKNMEIIHFFRSENAYLTERLLHHFFSKQKVSSKSDWFSLNPKEVNWFLEERFREVEAIETSLHPIL